MTPIVIAIILIVLVILCQMTTAAVAIFQHFRLKQYAWQEEKLRDELVNARGIIKQIETLFPKAYEMTDECTERLRKSGFSGKSFLEAIYNTMEPIKLFCEECGIEVHPNVEPDEDTPTGGWYCSKCSVIKTKALHEFTGTLQQQIDEAWPEIRTCRVCGCTDADCSQCIQKTGQPCHWVEDDLCSACVK